MLSGDHCDTSGCEFHIIGSTIWPPDGMTLVRIVAANDKWTFCCGLGLHEDQLRKPLQANWGVGRDRLGQVRRVVDIQLENPGDHDDRLRAVPILEHCKLEGFSPVDEKPAAEPLLILHDPMAVAVLPDAEQT
jgi:hypothetical protein